MSIVDFIESLKEEITSSEIVIKENALKRLVKFLSNLSFSEANVESVNFLIGFYINVLTVHYKLLPSILEGLTILIDFNNFSDSNAKEICESLVELEVQQYIPNTRIKIYELLDLLFTHNLKSLNSLNDVFLRKYLIAIDSESSPDCVYYVMKLNKVIVENLDISNVYEEFFESISAYFPVEFKGNKNSNKNLTREMLVEMNKQCMIGSPLFGAQLLPLLLEKITSDMKSARLDSLSILTDCLARMPFDDIVNYHMSFLDSLYYEYKNRDVQSQQLALQALQALSQVFQDKAQEDHLLEYCWHVYEVLNTVILDNDQKSLAFLQTAIGGKLRVWCGVMANMLPPLIDKVMKLEFEDTDKLEMVASLLASGDNWSKYRGIIDSSKAKVFFTRINLQFHKIAACPSEQEHMKLLPILFRLVAYYSLFDVWYTECDATVNYIADVDVVIQSRCILVTKAIETVLQCQNESLENALVLLTPLLVQSSICLATSDNRLTDSIYLYTDMTGPLQQLSFKILEVLPVSCLDMTLSVLQRKIDDHCVLDTVTCCLSNIINIFVNDPAINDKLSMFVCAILDHLILNQSILTTAVVKNLACAFGQLGKSTDEKLKSRIFDVLLAACRNADISVPCTLWLCALIGQSSRQEIELSIHTVDLLNFLFNLITRVEDNELKSTIYQTYASVVNKVECFDNIEVDFTNHLACLGGNAEFLLYNLKASMMASYRSASRKIIGILTDVNNLSVEFGSSLIRYIEILHQSPTDDKQLRLLPKQNLFYEQQSLYLIAQPFRLLATSSNENAIVKDISMEVYLKLIASYPKHIIDLSIDEIVTTVCQWLSQLAIMPHKTCLQLEALNAICHVHPSANMHLSNYIGDIVDTISALSNNYGTLVTHDRYFLAKVIGWFLRSFPDYDAHKYSMLLKSFLNRLINDKKRVVRREAAKSKMMLFA